jgi:hypothetical protein
MTAASDCRGFMRRALSVWAVIARADSCQIVVLVSVDLFSLGHLRDSPSEISAPHNEQQITSCPSLALPSYLKGAALCMLDAASTPRSSPLF